MSSHCFCPPHAQCGRGVCFSHQVPRVHGPSTLPRVSSPWTIHILLCGWAFSVFVHQPRTPGRFHPERFSNTVGLPQNGSPGSAKFGARTAPHQSRPRAVSTTWTRSTARITAAPHAGVCSVTTGHGTHKEAGGQRSVRAENPAAFCGKAHGTGCQKHVAKLGTHMTSTSLCAGMALSVSNTVVDGVDSELLPAVPSGTHDRPASPATDAQHDTEQQGQEAQVSTGTATYP